MSSSHSSHFLRRSLPSTSAVAIAEDVMSAVSRARLDLVLDSPFFGSLALRLRPVIDPTCQVLWTDGIRLGINPETFLALPPVQRKALIAHEVLHCANGHPWRKGARNKKTWARACDLAVNGLLLDAGFELCEGMITPDPGQNNQSAEQFYSELQRMPQDPDDEDGDEDGDGDGQGEGQNKSQGQGNGQGDGNGEGDGDKDGDGQGNGNGFSDPGAMRQPQNYEAGAAQNLEALENQWKIATIQAALAAKNRGLLPGSLAQLVENIKQPKIDWRAELRRFMQQHAKNDYAWTRPNSRYLARGLYMPALHSETIGPMVIAVDTSGSIGDEELKQFMGECQAIVEEIKPEYTVIIEVDAAVNGVNRYESGDNFTLPVIHGRGGTDFTPAFQYVEAEQLEPSCFVYLTDLYGSYPEQPPAYPVLWICTTELKATWGETIPMDIHEQE